MRRIIEERSTGHLSTVVRTGWSPNEQLNFHIRHWLILDEAHYLLPADWLPPSGLLPDKLTSMVLITVHSKYRFPIFCRTN